MPEAVQQDAFEADVDLPSYPSIVVSILGEGEDREEGKAHEEPEGGFARFLRRQDGAGVTLQGASSL